MEFGGQGIVLHLYGGIPVPAVGTQRFDQPQLADIPRNGGLRHIKSALAQLPQQLLLRIDRLPADQLQNFGVPFGFHALPSLPFPVSAVSG